MAAELALGPSHIACLNQHKWCCDQIGLGLHQFFLVQTFLCDIKSWKYNMPATDFLCNRTT